MAEISPSNNLEMAKTLEKRQIIIAELKNATYMQVELEKARKELLESTTTHDDTRYRRDIARIENDIMHCFDVAGQGFHKLPHKAGCTDDSIKMQISSLRSNIKEHIEKYQVSQSKFSKRLESQVERQYRIVYPTATDSQIKDGVQDVISGKEQLYKVTGPGKRSQQATDARAAVSKRSEQIRKIHELINVLHDTTQQLNEATCQQAPPLANIKESTDRAGKDIETANSDMDEASENARNIRKNKKYSIFAVVVIMAVIVIAPVLCGVTHSCGAK